MFTSSFLFASLIWGSIGVGYFMYGKRQQSWIAMVGGLVMIGANPHIPKVTPFVPKQHGLVR